MPPTEATGIRNKNYLNVKNGSSPWMDADGKESQTDSRGHAIFAEPAYGVRAGILLLRKYYFSHNLRTIAEILARWAPATDTIGSLPDAPPNSPLEYSTFVARRMGISYNERLDIFNANKSIGNIARLKDLFFAMSEFEIGNGFKVPVGDFNAGLELVQPGILANGTSPASNTATTPTAGRGAATATKQWIISGSVGRRDKSAVNTAADIETVQEMLRSAAMILDDSRVDPGAIDGKIGMDASKSGTVQAIEAFQSRFLTNPDGVIDVSGRTWRELLNVLEGGSEADTFPARPQGAAKFFFPFERLPSFDWTSGMRRFAANRSGGRRAHAGCDLYFPAGTTIHAVADGTVIRGPYFFYLGTYALEIDHGSFIARYGEIQQSTFVRQGDRVRAGQQIAKVGHLVSIQVPSDMLHLELYNKTASGPLTVSAAAGKKAQDGRPFMRRRDLIDPTPKLNVWKNNLPGARISPQERMVNLAGAPSKGFCIHIKRLRQEKRASENHARTVADYQCYWNGTAIDGLRDQIVERGGPGDNTTEVGDNRDLRIREGAYRLAIQNGVNYKTYNYKENGTTYEEKPKPGLLLMDTDERSAILIHPGEDYVRSIGCLNPASGLTDADSAINFMNSRSQVINFIKTMKSKMGTKFPKSGVIPDAIVLVEGEPA
jgi:murein DD-endopeptidase MepM/ murein hydrolase activator NlpD